MNGINFWIGNVHGKARPGEKEDTPVRIKQSEKIINYFKDLAGPKIIGGDFNLNPDTKSVEMFEKAGYRNLIKDFGIKNTRNKLSWEQFNNVQNFADYCFTSPEVKVKSFKVPYMEISDHLPQILDFEV
jgi:endonuclease/exonuclease/phosphatase family metal-dependent hydrolase